MDAFKTTPEIDAFIKEGIPAVDEKPTASAEPQTPRPESKAKPSEVSPKQKKKTVSRHAPSGETVRMHSKARIQKSVRFLPDLIIELEDHFRTLRPENETSLQTVMNEALEMWLNEKT